MNKSFSIIIFLIMAVNVILSANSHVPPGNSLPKVTAVSDYGKMPLTFIPNKGQMDKQVYFYIQGKDKSIYFTSSGLTYSLVKPADANDPGVSEPSPRWVVKMDFVGARKAARPECLEKSDTVVSYFKGKTSDWQTGLRAASKIIYRELWPGIDLVYYGTVNKMKYEFIVHPGADPAQIKLAYRGVSGIKETGQGQLEVQTPFGNFFDDTPVAWQEIAGKRKNVSLTYALDNSEKSKEMQGTTEAEATYGFSVGAYDRNQTLILDPAVIVYCGYIGGAGYNLGKAIALDAAGCAYVTGCTSSSETTFPVTTGPDLTHNGGEFDAFVAKVKADGTGLVYCGYIGGGAADSGWGIAVDASGCAYIAGETESNESTFPALVGPDLTHNGYHDAFVAKVTANGTGLVYCGYIGGSWDDMAWGIALDDDGCIYVSGGTCSIDGTFPVFVGPDLTYNGGNYDAFAAKVKADGTALDYCGYIGGDGDNDFGFKIAVDASGCAYITGRTDSAETTFPVTVGPDLTYNSGVDGFAAKIKADGTGFVYCGYIGGAAYEYGFGIAVDGSGCAYITGDTESTETTFPVAVGPDLTYNLGRDAFVAKIKADGTALHYCGYIGGSGEERGKAVAVDASGRLYVIGYMYGSDATFPVTVGPDLTPNGGGEAFVARIKANGATFDYCGFIGGSWGDDGYGIAADDSGNAYVTGYTYSSQATFPVTVGPDLTFNGNNYDAFVAKISGITGYTVNFAAGNGGYLTGITCQAVDHGGNCTPVTAAANPGYEFVNWTGTGGFVTSTDNPLTVTNVTTDMMITANFVFANPAGWVPVEGLVNNMVVYGKAYTGNNYTTAGDWIGAFGPGGVSDCRGAAAVQADGNYYLTVNSNETSGETITFKLWPLPAGPSIDGSETVEFIENGIYNGLPLHFGPRGQNIALVNGWNWISFNALPDDKSLNSVFGSLPGIVEQVKSQTQAAVYSGGSWIGDLTNMNGTADGIMYKVKTNQACAFNVTGMTIPFNQPLSLVPGWNWTAYLPTLNQPLDAAINSIITPLSQIKSQYKSAVKIGSTLYGDLTQMEPNKGYTILMNQAGVLEYPYGEAVFPDRSLKKNTDAQEKQTISWPIIKGNQYNMITYGKVFIAGKAVTAPGYYLVSRGPGGENDNRSFSPIGTDGSYFSTILGNTGGEPIKFKLFDGLNNRTFDVAGSLVFQPDNLKADFNLNARSIHITAPNNGETMYMGSSYNITWEAYEVNRVKIELFKGGKSLDIIAPSLPAGTHSYTWTIPARMHAGNNYHINISAVDAGVIAGDSSRNFTILPAVALCLNSPNGGQVWQAGRTYDITWGAGGIDNIKIDLYRNNVLYSVLTSNTPTAAGKFTWAIPLDQPVGPGYKITITSVDTGFNMSDTSDRSFTVTALKHIPGDFNNDGKTDLIWRYYGTGGYNCLWLLGTAPVSPAVNDPRLAPQAAAVHSDANLDHKIVGTGDFNHDGHEDIVWFEAKDGLNGNCFVWFMNGAVYLGEAQLPAENDPSWSIRGAGDFNRDGKADILWRNQTNGENKVWLMNDINRLSEVPLESFNDPDWDIYGVGDFNNDGKIDILWRNNSSGINKIWLMNGATLLNIEPLLAPVNPDWEITGVGDYDGNENTDICWRSQRDGRIKIWLMNGLSRVGTMDLTQVTNPNWRIDN